MIIRLKVFEQTLSIADTKSVPRKGSKDYLALQFLFSSDWKDLNKVCYLQHGEVSQPIDVVDGLVEVPEWFTEQDSFDVTLFGKSGSQEVPTNVVSLRLEKSNTLWEQDAPEPHPSWLAKIIDLNNHPPITGGNGYWLIWDTDRGEYVESELPLPAGGSGGTSDHSKLINRYKADQHPMSAVTGLVEALDGKQPIGDYLTQDNLQSATNAALAQAKASGEFDGAPGADGHTPEYGVDYGTPEQISGIAQSAAEILQPELNQIKDDIANVQLAVSEKMDSYTIKTVMDSVATPHTQYYLGEKSTVSIVLPDDAAVGQMVLVGWYNGDTAATLSITGTMLDFDFAPSANTRSEINALWDGRYWAVLGNEIAVPSEVTT